MIHFQQEILLDAIINYLNAPDDVTVMGKRGQSNFMFIIYQLLALGIVIVAFFGFVYKTTTDDYAFRELYTKDIALTMELMHGAPGELSLHYEFMPTKTYGIVFKEGSSEGIIDSIWLYDIKNKNTPAFFQFGRDPFISIERYEAERADIELIKQNNNINFTEIPDEIIGIFSDMPRVNTVFPTWKYDRSFCFVTSLDNPEMTLLLSRGIESALRIERRVDRIKADIHQCDADMTIAFNIKSGGEQSSVKIVYNDDIDQKSHKLAWLMRKHIFDATYEEKTFNQFLLTKSAEDTPLKGFDDSNVGVFIEFNKEEEPLLLRNQAILPIADAIREYYGEI